MATSPTREHRRVAGSPPIRRAELLAALSLAIDLGLGQPMEHMLGSCVLGARVAETLKLDTAQRNRTFYATLVSWIGCHADSYKLALAQHVGTDAAVANLLAFTFERWGGAGLPDGVRHEAIPLEMRVVHLCDTAEVHLRAHGRDATIAMLRERRGTQFDPEPRRRRAVRPRSHP